MPCPYCGHLLPKDAQACTQCDWTRADTQTAEGKASDAMAVLLSVIPGLGHIYKGHKLIGALIMGLWNPLTRHQERSAPFRLVRPDVTATRAGLATPFKPLSGTCVR